jgi:hypothetical protein
MIQKMNMIDNLIENYWLIIIPIVVDQLLIENCGIRIPILIIN